jgi:hypothetical protein
MRAILVATLFSACLCALTAEAEPTLLVMEPEIDGDLGPGGLAGHDARLALLEETLTQSISANHIYAVVDNRRAEAAFAKNRMRADVYACTPCAVAAGREAGAERVLSAWVYRMSNLVLSMQAILRDTDTGAIRYATAHDFRGDTEEAWLRAAARLVAKMEEDIPPNLR